MDLDQLILKNNKALEKRKDTNTLRHSNLLELSKQFPYYGYVEVDISNVPKFLMFYNNDDTIARTFFWWGKDSYEPTSLKIWTALSLNSFSILDVGAYSGVYSLAAASANPRAKIYSFEALDRVYSRLLVNQCVNNFINIKPLNFLISNSVNDSNNLNVYSGETILVSGSTTIDKSTQGKNPYETKFVKSATLDSMFADHQVSLIKIDVEGAELLVLEGSKNVIQNNYPDILMEVLTDADVAGLNELLKKYSYNYYSINDTSGEITQLDCIGVSKDILNILITKKSLKEIKNLI